MVLNCGSIDAISCRPVVAGSDHLHQIVGDKRCGRDVETVRAAIDAIPFLQSIACEIAERTWLVACGAEAKGSLKSLQAVRKRQRRLI